MTCRYSSSPANRITAGWDPITEAELIEAYRANALFDAPDDPEFGYRYLVEARDAGEPMAERTAWRICSQNRLWSVFGRNAARTAKSGAGARSCRA
ncbi:hypothetical protein MAUB_65390 (plasmid) [Mycolicibacterium aubagnense]|uniref:Uncharacterized protein n=1 Tax=Mycolicibacterium aubagnense TaxID=319707 RepID=A0ABM7INJ2_9MYCO|nr:hypothetical protein MAUB_65390 [Mycolicibacterium aubagnense]